MTALEFRKAVVGDIPQLVELAHELNLHHGDAFKPDAALLRKDWNRFEVFVVQDGHGKIMGFLSGYDTYQFHATTIRFEVQNLHVNENYRRQGVGRMLFEGTIVAKLKEGVKRFWVKVMADNQAARSFYTAMGFEERPKDHLRYVLGGEKLENFVQEIQKKG